MTVVGDGHIKNGKEDKKQEKLKNNREKTEYCKSFQPVWTLYALIQNWNHIIKIIMYVFKSYEINNSCAQAGTLSPQTKYI